MRLQFKILLIISIIQLLFFAATKLFMNTMTLKDHMVLHNDHYKPKRKYLSDGCKAGCTSAFIWFILLIFNIIWLIYTIATA